MKHDVGFIIYGPVRSGTTMFRLMLDNHPKISNPGEFDYLFSPADVSNGLKLDRDAVTHHHGFKNFGLVADPALSDEALLESLLAQITSRKPGVQSINVHHQLDVAIKLLPGVRVIKLHRDPRDVSRSCLPMGFAATLYHGVNLWIETERTWDRVKAGLAPDQYLELRFEDLVSDPESELARVCAFMGVEYDPGMLDYANNSTYERPDARVAYKWKRTMSPGDVALCSCRAADLIRSRGYEVPEGVAPPGAFKRMQLEFANRTGRLTFSVRRYGIALTLGEKVTRWLGMRGAHNRIRDKRNLIRRQYQK